MSRRYRRKLGKKAVSYPMEFTVVVSVIMVSLTLLFTAIGQMYTPYQVENSDLKAKAIAISERLIKDVGKCTDGSTDWEYHPSDLDYIGLASYRVLYDSWLRQTITTQVNDTNITDYPYLEFKPKTFYTELNPGEKKGTTFSIWNAGNGTLKFNLTCSSPMCLAYLQ